MLASGAGLCNSNAVNWGTELPLTAFPTNQPRQCCLSLLACASSRVVPTLIVAIASICLRVSPARALSTNIGNGTVTGHVLNHSSNEHLRNAVITVAVTDRSATVEGDRALLQTFVRDRTLDDARRALGGRLCPEPSAGLAVGELPCGGVEFLREAGGHAGIPALAFGECEPLPEPGFVHAQAGLFGG